jgi:hypothetical protein
VGARLLDDAIWTSDKLKKVPSHFRAEYANLLPLAEANGSFECEAELIWSKVYSFNRTEITPVIVEEILTEFEKADMLKRYVVSDKTYGYWIGIEKPGRLPAPSTRDKYINLPPDVPDLRKIGGIVTTKYITMEEANEIKSRFVPLPTENVPSEGTKRERSTGNLSIDAELVNRCSLRIGQPEDKKTFAKELKAAVKQYGHDEVLDAFDLWAETNTSFTGRKPISTFLRSLGGIISATPAVKVSGPALNSLETEIAYYTDNLVFFGTHQKPILAVLIKEYGAGEVFEAFRDFWTARSEDEDVKWASKNFLEQAALRIQTQRAKQKQREEKEATLAASLVNARNQAQKELQGMDDEPDDELE